MVINKCDEMEKPIVIPLEDGSAIEINWSISIKRVGKKVDMGSNEKRIERYGEVKC
jgi:hypothetical protein